MEVLLDDELVFDEDQPQVPRLLSSIYLPFISHLSPMHLPCTCITSLPQDDELTGEETPGSTRRPKGKGSLVLKRGGGITGKAGGGGSGAGSARGSTRESARALLGGKLKK